MRIKFNLIVYLLLLSYFHVSGQERQVLYYPGNEFEIRGKSKQTSSDTYNRIDSVVGKNLSERLQSLSQNTAGLYMEFQTNASFIDLKWELDSYKVLSNMTPLAVNGFDLYGWKNARWQYVASGIPKGQVNQVHLIEHMDNSMKRFRLYFPLYTGVKDLQIGLPSNAQIQPIERGRRLPKIVIYGSSITQGASASRPAMAFPSIIGRLLGVEVFNFGFSGAGKMEIEMADILKRINPAVFILDCVPNPSPKQIQQRTIPFVQTLRKAHPKVPILMVESIFRESANWNINLGERVKSQNKAFRKSYEKLLSQGFTELYYIHSKELIGGDHEATTDGVHFSDLGHKRMARTLEKELRALLEIQDNYREGQDH